MNTSPFLEKLLKNWPYKIFCFVIAVFIYCFHQLSTLETKYVTVPVSVKAGTLMSVGQISDRYVKVKLRGRSEQIATVTEDDLKAWVDVSASTEEGSHQIRVVVEPSRRVSSMEPLEISVKPEYVSVNLEEYAFGFARVVPVFSGDCAPGHVAAIDSVEPDFVRISGPKSMVEKVKKINTGAVNIDGATDSFVTSVAVINTNSLLKADTPIVKVNVGVKIVEDSRSFENIPITPENVPDEFNLSFDRTSFPIVASGALILLEQTKASDFVCTLDLSSVVEEGEYTIPVHFSGPRNLIISDSDENRVVVTATVKSVEDNQEKSENSNGDDVNSESETAVPFDMEKTAAVPLAPVSEQSEAVENQKEE